MDALDVTQLTKTYANNSVVKQLSFKVQRGECYGLLGPNGAGKTTTLKLCLGLTDPDRGKIQLLEYEIPKQASQARQCVGVVPQFDSLDPDFTVKENLQVFGRYFGLSDAIINQRIPQLLEFANLQSKANARMQELSGGMKRRLTLARALINDPQILFMDEPTTGLDPQARHMIWERLKNLIAQGKTLFLTTHFMDEAERLCDRLMILDQGHKIAEGAPRTLIAHYIEPHVIEVYGEQLDTWIKTQPVRFAQRTEQSGETVFCYTENPHNLIENLQAQTGLRYMHRPANLEDVFLKLTGREIRD